MANPHDDIAGVIAPPPIIYGSALMIGLLLHVLRPVRLFPRSVARSFGVLLMVSGLASGLPAFLALRGAGTQIDVSRPTTAIVTRGPYRYSRNPVYLGLTLLYSGIAVRANAFWPLLLLPVVLNVMRWGVIDREEQYLERRFGDEYLRYTMRVRRWV